MRTKLIVIAKCVIVAAVVAAILALIVSWHRHRAQKSLESCVHILLFIDGCKQQWAIENQATPDMTPAWYDLEAYVKSGGSKPHWAKCAAGGSYTIGTIAELPSCSIAEHQRAFETQFYILTRRSTE